MLVKNRSFPPLLFLNSKVKNISSLTKMHEAMKTDRGEVQFPKFVAECIYISTEELYNYVLITGISVSKNRQNILLYGEREREKKNTFFL